MTPLMKNTMAALLPILCLAGGASLTLAQNSPDYPHRLGVRIGYDGSANGLSYYHQLGKMIGMECSLGYNDKEGRRLEVSQWQKGNTMLDLNLNPYFYPKRKNTTATMYGIVGIGARFHNYRVGQPASGRTGEDGPSLITLDKRVGLGMLITPFPFVEGFLELGVNHYNTIHDYAAFSTESGIGLRVSLGGGSRKEDKAPFVAAKARFDSKNHL